jgi:crotonobetainyl-CoA:carnitine CoA-transferase CaiB-like acyl-CoA transferase
MAGMMLADYGATVIKVEPPDGDWARGSRGFLMWNRSKRSVVLELPSERSRLRDLVATCDVLLVGARPGVAERLGLGWDEVSAYHPTAVHCTITGFGPLTNFANVKAYEGVVAAKLGKMVGLDALSGAASGDAGDRPLYSAAPVAAYAASQLAFQGIVSALVDRTRTGRGCRVETSLVQGMLAGTMRQDFRREVAAEEAEIALAASGSSLQLKGITLTFLTAECSDGKWIQMCARQDHHFRSWMHALDLGHVLDEPRFARAPMGFQSESDIDELEALIRATMRREPQGAWMDRFIQHDVGADPFLTFDEFLEHPQMLENDRVLDVKDPEHGAVRQLGSLALLDGQPLVVDRSAPALGEHELSAESSVGDRADLSALSPALVDEPGPLAGVTVIELATYLAGPLGGTLLAEMGARVIKIETLEGDAFRRLGLQFLHLQHGKESIAVDLKTDAGREVLLRLVQRADVFFHNLRAGPVERLGCDFESLLAINPKLVYVNAAAYGSHGPEAGRSAFHSTPNALSGGGILQAGRGNPPVDDSYPDPCAGIAVASAMLLGMYARQRSGRGHYLETTMLCSAGYVHSDNLVAFEGAPPRLSVDPGQHGLHALYRLYPCTEGWLFVAVVQDHEWQVFAASLGHPEWCADPRFATGATRAAYDEALVEVIGEVLRTRTADDWEATLVAADLGCVRADAAGFEEFLASQSVLAAEDHPDLGPYWRMPTRVTFDRREGLKGAATALGESTVGLLAELGYDAQEIAELCAANVVHDGRIDQSN